MYTVVNESDLQVTVSSAARILQLHYKRFVGSLFGSGQ